MEYPGPQPADYDNVRALNRAFLNLLTDRHAAARLFAELPSALMERCVELTSRRRQRVAETPFLLFSFRERDAAYWDRLFEERRCHDLLAAVEPLDAALAGLVSAGLGFLWQLARQNTYTARLICGASLHWCEQLAERPLLEVVSVADARRLLTLRSPGDAGLWQKLLHDGASSDRAVSDAARLSALQRVLTHGRPPPTALAARKVRAPSLHLSGQAER